MGISGPPEKLFEMVQSIACGSREQKLVDRLLEALTESLELREILETAFPLLVQLVPADYGALCVSNPELAGGYDWAMVDFPVDWFNGYAEMAPHDFVRRAVLKLPNVVLRESEMTSRSEIDANMMYRRSLDMKMPIQHAMSVMLDPKTSWHAGITLYRGRPRPFSDQERALLQRLTPLIKNVVRNCKLFAEVSREGAMLDSILRHEGFEVIVMASSVAEIARSCGATPLITRWFAPIEQNRAGLPVALMEQLEEVIRCHGRPAPSRSAWTRSGPGGRRLEVTFVPIPNGAGRTVWALALREVSPAPNPWQDVLTPRECDVASRVILGWDNRLIAEDLQCNIATVKTHLYRIYNKLGVSSRTALCSLASQQR